MPYKGVLLIEPESFLDLHLAEISLMTYDQVVEIATDKDH